MTKVIYPISSIPIHSHPIHYSVQTPSPVTQFISTHPPTQPTQSNKHIKQNNHILTPTTINPKIQRKILHPRTRTLSLSLSLSRVSRISYLVSQDPSPLPPNTQHITQRSRGPRSHSRSRKKSHSVCTVRYGTVCILYFYYFLLLLLFYFLIFSFKGKKEGRGREKGGGRRDWREKGLEIICACDGRE